MNKLIPFNILTYFTLLDGERFFITSMVVRLAADLRCTSVRGQVRSPHISGGRRWLRCRQPACLQPRRLCHGTDGWIALFQNASLGRGHNKRIEIPFCEDRFTRAKETMRQIGVHTGATWRLRANDPYAVATGDASLCQLLWSLVRPHRQHRCGLLSSIFFGLCVCVCISVCWSHRELC